MKESVCMYWYICEVTCQPDMSNGLIELLDVIIPHAIVNEINKEINTSDYTGHYLFLVYSSKCFKSQDCYILSKILTEDNIGRYVKLYPYKYGDENLIRYMAKINIIQDDVLELIEIKKRNERKDLIDIFMYNNLNNHPDADKKVLQFIAEILYKGVPHVELDTSCESIRSTFRAGYCYYFAIMLKDAFQRGQVCLAYPLGHIVWLDTDGIPYDVEGINESACNAYVPISYLGEALTNFKHVPGEVFKTSTEYMESVFAKYIEDTTSGKDSCNEQALKWCRDNAPDSIKNLSDDELWDIMKSSYFKYSKKT